MKVAVYARVSTDRQDSLNQLNELRAYCARRSWEVVSEYVDEDVSGKQPRKPCLEELIRDAHQGRFEVVVFWALDRLTRLGPDDAADVLGRIAAAGVDFVSYREEAINSMGPWKRVLVDILAIVANFEAQRISDRTKAGLARARAMGTHLGRPRRQYAVTPAEVTAMRRQGLSWAEMADRTDTPTTSLRRLAKKASVNEGGVYGGG